ncbi:unnamed protein product [Prorocentrum cordatum]|uniref:Uncharacterized protein n=1 Tax=Prorocentrum cordatum TaxID=2364126 RepID=A0ABN9WXG8_9DINO|nr:unnamed protein product [Polarella glacialis]
MPWPPQASMRSWSLQGPLHLRRPDLAGEGRREGKSVAEGERARARRGGKAGTTAGQEGRKGQHSWRPDLSSEARPGRQPAARPFRRSAPGCQARRRGECQRRRRLEHRAAGRGARGVALHGGVREAALVGQRGGLVHRRPHLSEGLQKKTT